MNKTTGLVAASLLALATMTSAFAGAPAATTAPAATQAPAQAAAPAQAPAAQKPVAHHAMMSRERVEAVQTALNNNGAKVAVDGIWGRQTAAALKDFQQKHGIKPTGHPDSATLDQLKMPSKA